MLRALEMQLLARGIDFDAEDRYIRYKCLSLVVPGLTKN